MTNRPTEGEHWYSRDATPRYTTLGARGKKIPTTLRHALLHGLLPGVTSIIGEITRPGLAAYQRRQAIMAALTLPRRAGENDDELVARIERDAEEHAARAAEAGSAIHAALQRSIDCGVAEDARSAAIIAEVERSCGARAWESERCCVAPLGYGTKADLISTARDWVIDLKTKDGNVDDATPWPEHAMQLAATRHALAHTVGVSFASARCAIVFASRTDESVAVVEVSREALERGWEIFAAAHRIWCLRRDYSPGWAP